MNSDIRLSITFKGHRKRRRLRMLLGPDSTDYLIDLWLTIAQERPSGRLTGWDELDIALAAGWPGDASVFVSALMEAGFIDQDNEGTYCPHDWEEHQPWVIGAPQRSEAARIAGKASGAARKARAALSQEGTESNEAFKSVANPLNGSRTDVERNRTPSPYPFPIPEKELTSGSKELYIDSASKGEGCGENHSTTLVDIKPQEPKNLTEAERSVLSELKQVKDYPFNWQRDTEFVRMLMIDFPYLDVAHEARKWRTYKLDHPLGNKANPRSQFRNWLGNAKSFAQKKGAELPAVRALPDRSKDLDLIAQEIAADRAGGFA